jgi:hypothetical protein
MEGQVVGVAVVVEVVVAAGSSGPDGGGVAGQALLALLSPRGSPEPAGRRGPELVAQPFAAVAAKVVVDVVAAAVAAAARRAASCPAIADPPCPRALTSASLSPSSVVVGRRRRSLSSASMSSSLLAAAGRWRQRRPQQGQRQWQQPSLPPSAFARAIASLEPTSTRRAWLSSSQPASQRTPRLPGRQDSQPAAVEANAARQAESRPGKSRGKGRQGSEASIVSKQRAKPITYVS